MIRLKLCFSLLVTLVALSLLPAARLGDLQSDSRPSWSPAVAATDHKCQKDILSLEGTPPRRRLSG